MTLPGQEEIDLRVLDYERLGNLVALTLLGRGILRGCVLDEKLHATVLA
jgi:hypothetical protein